MPRAVTVVVYVSLFPSTSGIRIHRVGIVEGWIILSRVMPTLGVFRISIAKSIDSRCISANCVACPFAGLSQRVSNLRIYADHWKC